MHSHPAIRGSLGGWLNTQACPTPATVSQLERLEHLLPALAHKSFLNAAPRACISPPQLELLEEEEAPASASLGVSASLLTLRLSPDELGTRPVCVVGELGAVQVGGGARVGGAGMAWDMARKSRAQRGGWASGTCKAAVVCAHG